MFWNDRHRPQAAFAHGISGRIAIPGARSTCRWLAGNPENASDQFQVTEGRGNPLFYPSL
jgi:hypothetical protein